MHIEKLCQEEVHRYLSKYDNTPVEKTRPPPPVEKPRLISLPMDQSVVQGQTTSFTCICVCDAILWSVNGIGLTTILKQQGYDEGPVMTIDEDSNIRTTNLTVTGTISDNGSTIRCSAVLLNPLSVANSDKASLLPGRKF